MPIRKIKAGLVLTKDVDEFVGEPGYLFYDEDSNGDKTLRISDGVTPGGVSFLTAGDSSVSGISQSTLRVAGDDSSAIELDLSGTGETFTIAGGNSLTSSIAGDVVTLALDKNITVNQISSNDSTAVQVADNFVPTEDDTYSLGTPDKRFSEIHVSQGSIFLGDLVIRDSGDGRMQIFQADGVTPARLDGPLHKLTLVGDDSTGTTLDLNNTVKFQGTGGITVSVLGDAVTIDGSGVAGSGSGTLTVSDDASTTVDITTGQDTLKFQGGNNITTALTGDTLTIDGPSNISDLTNDSGYIDTAQLTIVGDDSTGTAFDTTQSPTVRFLGAGNVSVAVSGSNVIITGTGAGGSATYTQDTAPANPSDGETWFDTDSGGLYVFVEEAGTGQWIETGSAGTTLDVDGVDSIRFAADDSASVAVGTSETLSILGGQGIATSVTAEGEIRISSTGSSVTTDDAAPSNPNDGDLWYETDTGSLYVYVVEGGSAHWVETGGGSGTSASVITQDDQPQSASDGNLWFDTDQGGLYVFVEEDGSGQWIETGTSGSGPAIYTQDDSPSTPSNGDLWWDTDSGSLYIYIAQNGSTAWVETSGSGQTGGGGITSLAADATPELGGNLDANAYNITNVGTISVATNGDPGVDPATDSGVGYIYAKGATAELFVKDGAGNITQISPHNEDAEWIYYSENVKTGKRVKVNMEKMIRRLEEITGETFFEIDEPHKLKP